MAVHSLYALQNGFMGAQRSLLFYGEFAEARTQIPITSYVVRTSDAVILYDTGVSPRAVPGLIRSDTLARFTEDDLLVHRLDTLGLESKNVDLVVPSARPAPCSSPCPTTRASSRASSAMPARSA